jgi:hypothetical protein
MREFIAGLGAPCGRSVCHLPARMKSALAAHEGGDSAIFIRDRRGGYAEFATAHPETLPDGPWSMVRELGWLGQRGA